MKNDLSTKVRSLFKLMLYGIFLQALFISLPPAQAAISQQSAETTIRGKVTDDSGEALPGATVLVKETSIGTITDMEGRYSLNVPEEATTLIFSYIGYLQQEVAINGRSVIDISLKPDITSLEEVVVVGYGTQEKSAVTGSVASLSHDR